jgi:uncharacterized protein
MGYREISLKLPTDYDEELLQKSIGIELGISGFSFQIENKSLDARKKDHIHWLLRVAVSSGEIEGGIPETAPSLIIPYRKRREKAVIAGSGPAGLFSALVLQKAGFQTTILERGTDVLKRAAGIRDFEMTGNFDPLNNYAFGEGGAGTFSDGKLTSRSKHISKERQFILSTYIEAGAPEEIGYMAHPHLGSDNLRKIVRNLREEYVKIGGTMRFETMLKDLKTKDGKVIEAVTDSGEIQADYFFIAPGHSAYETYRMLIRRGVPFRTKNFALGSRVEHPQEIINKAQWGRESLPGVKAAEYRLTSKGDGNLPVYTFCMCPGGIIVPSTAYENGNIVNGMSRYARNGKFANAACVAGVHPDQLLGKQSTPLEALDWLESLEEKFYRFSNGYQAPFSTIRDFISSRESLKIPESSYPLGLKPAALWDLLPSAVSSSIRKGLRDFSRKIRGFENGIIMGLESKTSSPVQAVREKDGRSAGFENLYIIGEGSGCAGGIISSGADGIRAAMHLIGKIS